MKLQLIEEAGYWLIGNWTVSYKGGNESKTFGVDDVEMETTQGLIFGTTREFSYCTLTNKILNWIEISNV